MEKGLLIPHFSGGNITFFGNVTKNECVSIAIFGNISKNVVSDIISGFQQY